jgi:hypothetical protein
LREFGYNNDPQVRGSISKPAGPRVLSIQKWRPARSPSGQVGISLDICKPYLGGLAIILQGSLREDLPPIISVAGGDLWGPEEGDTALAATIQHGLPWLEKYSDAHQLIQYYEVSLKEGLPRKDLKLPPIVEKMTFGPKPSETVRRPPIFNWCLAELYSEVGDDGTSLKYAQQYFATLPDNRFHEEERAKVMDFINKLLPESSSGI